MSGKYLSQFYNYHMMYNKMLFELLMFTNKITNEMKENKMEEVEPYWLFLIWIKECFFYSIT